MFANAFIYECDTAVLFYFIFFTFFVKNIPGALFLLTVTVRQLVFSNFNVN
jgi:hypothetical protein